MLFVSVHTEMMYSYSFTSLLAYCKTVNYRIVLQRLKKEEKQKGNMSVTCGLNTEGLNTQRAWAA